MNCYRRLKKTNDHCLKSRFVNAINAEFIQPAQQRKIPDRAKDQPMPVIFPKLR